jgi:hypothetical protein
LQSLQDIAPYVALGAAIVDLVLIIVAVVLVVRVGRLRRAQMLVLGQHGERDIVAHTQQLEEQVRNLRMAVEALDRRIERHKAELDHAFTSRAVVRYNAFDDIGGEQSASIALLDRHRSGVVMSSIHSRDYARLYVTQMREGVPDRPLSPEEDDVVERATQPPASDPPVDERPQ